MRTVRRVQTASTITQDFSDQLDNGAIIVEGENSAHALHNGPWYREPLEC
jgi:hypothetical protein